MTDFSRDGFKSIRGGDWFDFVARHNDLKHYVSVAARPGNLALMAAVEYSLFPPESKANEKFHVHIVEWKGEPWNIFSAPRERHDDVIRTAKALAMSITKSPPAVLSFGRSAIVMAAPPTKDEAEIKKALIQGGLPRELVNLFSGLETFPSQIKATHTVENDQRLLNTPLQPDEKAAFHQREMEICNAMSYGVRPSAKEIADYIYGSGRVRTSPRPA